jgi:hypothetical protein
MQRLVLLLALAACHKGGNGLSGGDDVVIPDGPSGDAPPTIDFQPFTTRTRSFGLAGDVHQLALTDTTGPIACGLSKDYHNGLGTAGAVILINVTPAQGTPCTTGTYSIRSNCSTDFGSGNPYAVPDGCAYYRRYNAQAQMLGILAASAGSVQITGNESSCTFTTNLSFAGQAYSDTVTLTNGLTAQPWCK